MAQLVDGMQAEQLAFGIHGQRDEAVFTDRQLVAPELAAGDW